MLGLGVLGFTASYVHIPQRHASFPSAGLLECGVYGQPSVIVTSLCCFLWLLAVGMCKAVRNTALATLSTLSQTQKPCAHVSGWNTQHIMITDCKYFMQPVERQNRDELGCLLQAVVHHQGRGTLQAVEAVMLMPRRLHTRTKVVSNYKRHYKMQHSRGMVVVYLTWQLI
jgi:hypothetical protein